MLRSVAHRTAVSCYAGKLLLNLIAVAFLLHAPLAKLTGTVLKRGVNDYKGSSQN